MQFRRKANFLFLPVARGCAKRVSDGLREHSVSVRPFTEEAVDATSGTPEIGDGLRITVGPWQMMERFLDALDAVRSANPEWLVRTAGAGK